MPVIKVTQVINAHELKEITTLKVVDKFERFRRIFRADVDKAEPLQVWIDEMSEDGNDLIGDPIAITASQGLFLLKDFYKRPKKEWSKIKENN